MVERSIKQHRLWVTVGFTEPHINDILLGKLPGSAKIGHFQHICETALEPCIFILLIKPTKYFISEQYIKKNCSHRQLSSHNQLLWDQRFNYQLGCGLWCFKERETESICFWTQHSVSVNWLGILGKDVLVCFSNESQRSKADANANAIGCSYGCPENVYF